MTRLRLRPGRVREVLEAGEGWQRLLVEVDDPEAPGPAPAWHDTGWLGPLAPGDRVILNTTAVWLGLGSGGQHFVYWVEGREPPPFPGPEAGHIVKLRYSPAQLRVQAVEERHGVHAALAPGQDVRDALAGLPVVVGTLHSQLAPAVAGIAAALPGARVVYVLTDGGALPARLSRTVRELGAAGLLVGTISCGHAYGGDLEAVTPASALVAARRLLDADAAVALMGPGVVGTGTALGTTALEAAALVDTVAALGGRPVFAVRLGAADARARHRGVSHHALTALALMHAAALVAVPFGRRARAVLGALRAAGLAGRHLPCLADGHPGLRRLAQAGIEPRTMGRGPAEEPEFFLAASAAGYLAGRLAAAAREGRRGA